LTVAHYLAWALRDMGRYAEARELDEDTLARSRRVLGDDHRDTLNSANNLAYDLRSLGEYQAARELDAGVDPTQVAEWAGNSVEVLLRVYAKCIHGREKINRKLIEEALREGDGDEEGW
jgi:hypothetical protein